MGPKIEEIDDMPPLEDPEEESTAETGEVRLGPDRSLPIVIGADPRREKAPRRREWRILTTTDHPPSNA